MAVSLFVDNEFACGLAAVGGKDAQGVVADGQGLEVELVGIVLNDASGRSGSHYGYRSSYYSKGYYRRGYGRGYYSAYSTYETKVENDLKPREGE